MTFSNIASSRSGSFQLPAIDRTLLSEHLDTVLATWAAALSANNFDAAWIAAGTPHLYFQDDHGPMFKPNPYFTQWVDPEYAQAGAHLLIRPQHAQPLVLFTPQPQDYWHRVAPAPSYLEPDIEVRTFPNLESLGHAAIQEMAGADTPAYIGAQVSNEFGGQLNPIALLNRLDFQRATKTRYEQALMRNASIVGALGHRAAAQSFVEGGSEFDIHMAYLQTSNQSENQLPYSNIVALNEHAATLHYQAQDRTHSTAPKSLLIDAGGQCRGYASDITRTYVAAGTEHSEFAGLISAMQHHQDDIIDSIAVGKTYADLHEYMHRNLAAVLSKNGIVTCSPEEAFEQRINEAFCPHGLGHLLGIQVHDVGGHLGDAEGNEAPPAANYPSLRFTREIAQDQIFTIEPGLYFIPALLAPLRDRGAPINWSLVDQLTPYGGIRIEDNVRVLAQGVENLTRDAFAQVNTMGVSS